MTDPPVVVLGHQRARAGAGEELAALNAELATALAHAAPAATGLLAYQPLRNLADTDRFCVYWLWRHQHDRDAVWAQPPDALRRFWRLAGPLWHCEPVVARYSWWPHPVRDICPAAGQVCLSADTPPSQAAGSVADWLVPCSPDDTAIRVQVGEAAGHDTGPGRTSTPVTPLPAAPDGTIREPVPCRWAVLGASV